MDSITSNKRVIAFVLIALSCFVAASCKTIEGVRITNDSMHTLTIRAFFISKEGNQNQLDFSLAPGGTDFWQYEANRQERETVDYTFQKMVISTPDGCFAQYDRNDIEDAARKKSMWTLIITDSDLGCK